MAISKSCLGNSNIPVILMLTPVGFIFLFSVRSSWFMVWWAVLLGTNLHILVIILLISSGSYLNFCFSWLPLTPLHWEKAQFYYCQVRLDVQVPHRACPDTTVDLVDSLLGGGDSHNSSIDLLWHHLRERERVILLLSNQGWEPICPHSSLLTVLCCLFPGPLARHSRFYFGFFTSFFFKSVAISVSGLLASPAPSLGYIRQETHYHIVSWVPSSLLIYILLSTL